MNQTEKRAFLSKLQEDGKHYEDFNAANQNYWKGRILLGVAACAIIGLLYLL